MIEHRRDEQTGVAFRVLTAGAEGSSTKLYFSSESWLPDDVHIAFARGGKIICLNTGTGEEFAAIDEGEGFAAHTFGLSRTGAEGFALRGTEVWAVDMLTGEKRFLAGGIPENAHPTGQFEALKSGALPMTYRLKNGIHVLMLSEPETGTSRALYYSDVWLAHCQGCPGDDDTIFFVHESAGDGDAIQRMWHFIIGENRPVPYYVERFGELITHESWTADGEHMTFCNAPDQIWMGTRDGRCFKKIASSKEYHHCAASRSKRWIAADRSDHGEVVLVNAETGEDTLLLTGLRPRNGGEHMHPSFNRRGDRLLTSLPDGNGRCDIAEIDLTQLEGFAP